MAVRGETGRKVIERVLGKGGGRVESKRGWYGGEWPLSFENYRRGNGEGEGSVRK